LQKRGWKVLIRKDWRWKMREKRGCILLKTLRGLFAERMQEITALVARAAKSWLEGRAGEELDAGRKFDDGVAATIMDYFTS